MKTVTLELTRDQAELVMYALRMAAEEADRKIFLGMTTHGHDQPGILRYVAVYIEHKMRDAGGGQ